MISLRVKPSDIAVEAAEVMFEGKVRSYVHAIEAVAPYIKSPFQVLAVINCMRELYDFLNIGICCDLVWGEDRDISVMALLFTAERLREQGL